MKGGDSRELLLIREVDSHVGRNSLESVESVQVLVQGDLEDGRSSVSRGDGRRGEEVGPDSEPPGTEDE